LLITVKGVEIGDSLSYVEVIKDPL